MSKVFLDYLWRKKNVQSKISVVCNSIFAQSTLFLVINLLYRIFLSVDKIKSIKNNWIKNKNSTK